MAFKLQINPDVDRAMLSFLDLVYCISKVSLGLMHTLRLYEGTCVSSNMEIFYGKIPPQYGIQWSMPFFSHQIYTQSDIYNRHIKLEA